MSSLRNRIYNADGWEDAIAQVFLYDMLFVYTLIISIQYFRRTIYLAFLTAIAPLITLTYPLDKIKDKRKLLEKIEKYKGEYNFDAIIPISARTKDGIEELKETVAKFLPYGPQYYPEDMITDSPERVMVSEIIREKALKFLQDEIPHGIAVDIEKMKKRTGKEITDITATIYCERESHKSIIIGKGGAKLKQIGSEAREDIEKLLSMKVYLDIWVKVRNDWRNNEAELRKLNFLQD
jgi:GTP-binding protein Era